MRVKKSFVKHIEKTVAKLTKSQQAQNDYLVQQVLNEFIMLYEETRGTSITLFDLWQFAIRNATERNVLPAVVSKIKYEEWKDKQHE